MFSSVALTVIFTINTWVIENLLKDHVSIVFDLRRNTLGPVSKINH